MTRSHHCRGPICWFVKLLLIVLLGVGSASFQANGASLRTVRNPFNMTFENIVKKLDKTIMNTDGITTQIRKHVLYNECTKRFVQIDQLGGKGIKARGTNFDELSAQLVFEPTHRPTRTIKIHGKHTGYYMCFNRRGKLLARQNGNKISCEFIEEYSEEQKHFIYRTADPRYNWYLGFKKRNGRPYKGSAKERFPINSRKQKCFEFLKVNPKTANEKCVVKPENGPSVNVCHPMFSNFFNSKKSFKKTERRPIRRRKHHKQRGKNERGNR